VGEGTQIPESAAPISIENFDRLVPLSRWGNGTISRIQYSPDGQYLVVGSSTGLYFHEASDFSLANQIVTNSAILDMAISPDGKTIAALSYDQVFLFDFFSRELLRVIDVKATCAFSPDGNPQTKITTSGFGNCTSGPYDENQ
jgi:WD40 repeat protein